MYRSDPESLAKLLTNACAASPDCLTVKHSNSVAAPCLRLPGIRQGDRNRAEVAAE